MKNWRTRCACSKSLAARTSRYSAAPHSRWCVPARKLNSGRIATAKWRTPVPGTTGPSFASGSLRCKEVAWGGPPGLRGSSRTRWPTWTSAAGMESCPTSFHRREHPVRSPLERRRKHRSTRLLLPTQLRTADHVAQLRNALIGNDTRLHRILLERFHDEPVVVIHEQADPAGRIQAYIHVFRHHIADGLQNARRVAIQIAQRLRDRQHIQHALGVLGGEQNGRARSLRWGSQGADDFPRIVGGVADLWNQDVGLGLVRAAQPKPLEFARRDRLARIFQLDDVRQPLPLKSLEQAGCDNHVLSAG